MSKAGSFALGAVVVVVSGGYFAYEELGWFKSKPDEPTYESPSSQAGEAAASTPKPPKERTIPDLRGLDVDEARAAVKKAGFDPSTLEVAERAGCRYDNDRDMLPQGKICSQEPTAGLTMNVSRIRVAVEQDTFEHGGVGTSSEWRRMPDLAGHALADAKRTLAEAGFLDDEFEVAIKIDRDCPSQQICEQKPEAGARKVKVRQGTLVVGK